MIEIIPMSDRDSIGLDIFFSIHDTRWGLAYIASTERGICGVGFCKDALEADKILRSRFDRSNLIQQQHTIHSKVLSYLDNPDGTVFPYPLHIHATPFRLKVWKHLLAVPHATTTTYGEIARSIGARGASRAVGSAVGANPVAIIIPCHRVIRADGAIGNYRWEAPLKKAILSYELSRR